jgi:hypothetical protein
VRDLTRLTKPFGAGAIKSNPKGGSYVAHPVVEQRLLDVCGPVATEVVQIIRGYVVTKNEPLQDACVAVVLRMTAVIDGRHVSVEEVGDCESPGMWATDGARLKDAMSDAYKRCAMRLGVGLHLWAQEDFYLYTKLATQDSEAETQKTETVAQYVNGETGEVLAAVPSGEEPF